MFWSDALVVAGVVLAGALVLAGLVSACVSVNRLPPTPVCRPAARPQVARIVGQAVWVLVLGAACAGVIVESLQVGR